MEITFEDANRAYTEYNKSDSMMTNFIIDFPDGLNDADPLLMIKTMQNRRDLYQQVEYTNVLIRGKQVKIYIQDEVGEKTLVQGFTHNGQGELSHLFQERPYLLQLLLDYCIAYLIKKLTPPSSVSKE